MSEISSTSSATTWVTPDCRLHPARHPQEPPRDHRAAKALVDLLPDDHVADPELVLQRDEDHPLGRAGPLPHEDKPRHRHPRPLGRQVQQVMGKARGRARPVGGGECRAPW